MAPIIAAAAPWILSAIGAMLPNIIDAFRTGKSPEEAKAIVEPHRKAIIERLIGAGLSQAQATAVADEQIKGELEKAQLPEQMNPWLSAALSVGGAVGGFKLGGMMKGAPKVSPSTAAAEEAKPSVKEQAPVEQPRSSRGDVYTPGFKNPAVDRALAGELDQVNPVGGATRRGGNIEYNPRTDQFTMIDTESPFPSKGRGDFNVEIIGNTGSYRSIRPEIEGPMPNMARGGELLMAPDIPLALEYGRIPESFPDVVGKRNRIRMMSRIGD